MLSSLVMFLEDRFELFSLGTGGGEGLFLPFGGVTERRDFLELRDGVLCGVSRGVGRAVAVTGPPCSSSVSQTAMLRRPTG